MQDKKVGVSDGMTDNDGEWDYTRLYGKLASYVLEGEPVRAPLLFDALSKREGKDVSTGLSPFEYKWLQWNLGFVKRVIKTPLLATMIFLVHKSAFSSFTIGDVSKKAGRDVAQVCRYARELEGKNLLKKLQTKFDKHVYYTMDDQLPTIHRVLIELVVTHYGVNFFENFLKPNEEKTLRHSKFMREHRERARRYKSRISRSKNGTIPMEA